MRSIKILLCNSQISAKTEEILKKNKYRIFYIPKCSSLAKPVCSHPDMLFSITDERTILTDGNYFAENAEFFNQLSKIGLKTVCSEKRLSDKYPNDILFDAVKTDKILIGNLKYTAPELFSEGIRSINVKQGYALCSTLLMKNSAITSDKGIYNAISENGYRVLQISSGDIYLNGYDCGFIGGASIVLEKENIVVFFGKIKKHRDGEKIVNFCEDQGYSVVFDKETELSDFGGAKVLNYVYNFED